MEQLTLDDAKVRRDEAMATVEANAERTREGFMQEAMEFALRYLREHGDSSSEDISDACRAAGLVPHDDRAFGPVFKKLYTAGKIRKVGFCQRRKGHATSGGNIWGLDV